MTGPALHRFEQDGKRFVIDPESCFCFECDGISWDVIAHFPHETVTRIIHLLEDRHPATELAEVLGELEWLRATKAILQRPKLQDLEQLYTVTRGLKAMTVALGDRPEEQVTRAGRILVGRAGEQQQLYLTVRLRPEDLERPGLAASLERVAEFARDGGKALTVGLVRSAVALEKPHPALAGHRVSAIREWQPDGEALGPVLAALRGSLRDVKRLAALVLRDGTEAGEVVLTPGTGDVAAAVKALADAGALRIRLDLTTPFVEAPDLAPAVFYEGLRATAWQYARDLLANRFYRLEPLAALFHQIHQGTTCRRRDGAGLHELALAGDDTVHPGPDWLGLGASPIRTDAGGRIDAASLKVFEDAGSLTTPACMACWARNLCGGGVTAVHRARTGNWRTPDPAWCDAQRAWLENTVAAFNVLSTEGVNFSRLEGTLARTARPGILQLARAAFRMQVGLRPIGESDAALLAGWEQWNGAAYFSATEFGILTATEYDREMDALHPRPLEQELLVLRKSGAPFGLLRLRPDRFPGVVQGWVYFRSPADYASSSVRKSFRFMLGEAAAQQDMRRLIVPVGPEDPGLADFLLATGFRHIGVQRESLYLHGQYRDLDLYLLEVRQD